MRMWPAISFMAAAWAVIRDSGCGVQVRLRPQRLPDCVIEQLGLVAQLDELVIGEVRVDDLVGDLGCGPPEVQVGLRQVQVGGAAAGFGQLYDQRHHLGVGDVHRPADDASSGDQQEHPPRRPSHRRAGYGAPPNRAAARRPPIRRPGARRTHTGRRR